MTLCCDFDRDVLGEAPEGTAEFSGFEFSWGLGFGGLSFRGV